MKSGKKQTRYFIGIGGIGMSSLARYYHAHGDTIFGSDETRSEITDELRREGIKVSIGAPNIANIPKKAKTLIYTPALQKHHLELVEAKKRGIQCLRLDEALGEITKNFITIAISGMHGKSTTTAMTARILIEAGFDPTVIIGTKVPEFKNKNFRKGKSKYLIIEADEYKRKFLSLHPNIAIVTNIDREHLDYFRNIDDIKNAYKEFFKKIPRQGSLILNADDPNLKKMVKKDTPINWYSLGAPERKLIEPILKVPGLHNLSNALAAWEVGRILGIPPEIMQKALSKFTGTWRRFDFQGIVKGAKIFADYAHHPTEIKKTLEGARQAFPEEKIHCIFQPHQEARLKILFNEFVDSFEIADTVAIVETYHVPGREEKNISGKNASTLAKRIGEKKKHTTYLENETLLKKYVDMIAEKRSVIIIMGAGTIWEATKTLNRNKNRKNPTTQK